MRGWLAARVTGKAGTPTKLFDGGGLYLTRTKAGTPAWRLKYRFGGTERVFALGRFPAVTLEQARRERERIRGELQAGADPMAARRARRQSGAAQQQAPQLGKVALATGDAPRRGESQVANVRDTARGEIRVPPRT